MLVIIFDNIWPMDPWETQRHERVRAGPQGTHWRVTATDTTWYCATWHGERFTLNWFENMNTDIFCICYFCLIDSLSPEGCWTQNVSENWELIVTINPFQVWSVWPSQPIRGQYCVCVTNQRPVSRSGYNWVCNCVSLRYKCHISDISDIRNGVPAINADLHRNIRQKGVDSYLQLKCQEWISTKLNFCLYSFY